MYWLALGIASLEHVHPGMTQRVIVEIIHFEIMGIIGIKEIQKNSFEVKVLYKISTIYP